MKNIMLLSGLLFVLLFCVRCEDSLDGTTFSAYNEQPVGLWLENHPEYSEFVKLLKKTDLYNALNVKMDFTCFVCDNDAVAAYLKSKGLTSVDQLDNRTAAYLMSYHIIPGNKYDHTAFTGKLADSTASGDYLTVKPGIEGGINSIYVNNYSLIVQKDMEAINGIIHKLDRMLDPIVVTIADVIRKSDRYTLFSEALDSCGFNDLLSSRTRVVGITTIRDYKTVFVVSDSVFRENNIASYADLKAAYPDTALRQFMAYHIINANSDFGDLGTFITNPKTNRKNILTYAHHQLISVVDQGSEIILNDGSEAVRLVEGHYDMQGNNGYVHEIDKLMNVAEPEPALVIWQFTDVIDCQILPLYKQWTDALNQKSYTLDYENLQEVRWETVPASTSVGKYQLRKDNNMDNDYFLFSLGYVGWIEFDLPVLAKGKYDVSIARKVYNNGRGTCYFYIDEKKNSATISCATGSKPFKADQQVFDVQGPHKIRFTAFKPGTMDMDYITFTPKK